MMKRDIFSINVVYNGINYNYYVYVNTCTLVVYFSLKLSHILVYIFSMVFLHEITIGIPRNDYGEMGSVMLGYGLWGTGAEIGCMALLCPDMEELGYAHG